MHAWKVPHDSGYIPNEGAVFKKVVFKKKNHEAHFKKIVFFTLYKNKTLHSTYKVPT